jgi:hypothetical protein
VRAVAIAASVVAVSATLAATAGTGLASVGTDFVPASKSLVAACHRTARAVGYRVPCPLRVPLGLTQTGTNGPTGCTLDVIGPGGVGGCAASWRGWVVGSSTTPDQHLVITASPRLLRNDAKVVNGPAWYPGARVKPLTRLTINGWRIRAVFVPQATNDGSAFARHVVLIWTVGDHTYAIGFHDVRGIQQTLELDEEFVASVRLVR